METFRPTAVLAITLAGAPYTLRLFAPTSEICYQQIIAAGVSAGSSVVAPLVAGFTFCVINNSDGPFEFGGATGAAVSIPVSTDASGTWVTTDGTNYGEVGGGANTPQQNAFVWQPGGTGMGPNVFASFADAVAACNALDGAPCEILVDGSIASPILPAGAFTGIGAITFVANDDNIVMTAVTGTTFDRPPMGLRNITLTSTASAPVVTLTSSGAVPVLYLENASIGSSDAPFIHGPTGSGILQVFGVGSDLALGAGQFDGSAEVVVSAIDTDVSASALSGTGTSSISFDASSTVSGQTITTLATTRLSQAAFCTPASGSTSQRPGNAQTGQMFFDTTLNQPIWWNGSTWVAPTGPAGPAGTAYETTTNQSSLIASTAVAYAQVLLLSRGTLWIWDPNDRGTSDLETRMFSTMGPGNWCYVAPGMPTETLSVTTWIIDPLFGNDDNGGAGSSLAGTVNVQNGSPNLTFTTAQTLPSGTILYFASQPGTPYTLSGPITGGTTGTLSANYTGVTNTATTALAAPTGAIQHAAELYRRLGTWSPEYDGVNVTLYLVNNATSDDPFLFEPTLLGSATFSIVGVLPLPSFVGALNVVTPKSTPANQPLQTTFTTTSGAVAPNMLLINTTKGSRAFASLNAGGGTWTLSQPMVSPVSYPIPAADNTWTSGDAIEGYVLLRAQISTIGGRCLDTSTSSPAYFVKQLQIQAPQLSNTNVLVDVCYAVEDSTFTNSVSLSGEQTILFGYFTNFGFLGGVFSHSSRFGGHSMCGGYSTGGGIGVTEFPFGVRIINDLQIFGANFFTQDCPDFNADIYLAPFLAAYIIGGTVSQTVGAIYGGGSLSLNGGLYFNDTGNSWVDTLPLAGGIFIQGRQEAYSFETTAGLTQVRGGIALTAANLDAAPPIGFGGFAFAGASAYSDNRQP